MKKIAILTLALISMSTFAQDNFSYRYPLKGVDTQSVSEPAASFDSTDTTGWDLLFEYEGTMPTQTKFDSLVTNMQEGIKIIFTYGEVAFISKTNLLNANCKNISEYTVGERRIFWSEPNCSASGMDYSHLNTKEIPTYYDHNNYWDYQSFSDKIKGGTGNKAYIR